MKDLSDQIPIELREIIFYNKRDEWFERIPKSPCISGNMKDEFQCIMKIFFPNVKIPISHEEFEKFETFSEDNSGRQCICSHHITFLFNLRHKNGWTFLVGCECILKQVDNVLAISLREAKNKMQRMKRLRDKAENMELQDSMKAEHDRRMFLLEQRKKSLDERAKEMDIKMNEWEEHVDARVLARTKNLDEQVSVLTDELEKMRTASVPEPATSSFAGIARRQSITFDYVGNWKCFALQEKTFFQLLSIPEDKEKLEKLYKSGYYDNKEGDGNAKIRQYLKSKFK